MKFSHSLKFNVVPEWQDDYINYTGLKKTIYQLQRDQLSSPNDGSINVKHGQTVTELMDSMHHKPTVELIDEKKSRLRNLSILKFKKEHHHPEPTDDHSADDSNETSIKKSSVNDTESEISFDSDIVDPTSSQFDPLKVFTRELLAELAKINRFYIAKEAEYFNNYDDLMADLDSLNVNIDDIFKFTQAYQDPHVNDQHHNYNTKSTLTRTLTNASVFDTINQVDNDYDNYDIEKQVHVTVEDDDEEEDDSDEEDDLPINSALLTTKDFHVKFQKKITLKKQSTQLFINLSQLKSFIELNKIGFTKITKKFDKICNYQIKQDFINNFLPLNYHVFEDSTLVTIDLKLNEIVKIYAFLSDKLTSRTTQHDLEAVKTNLKSHLREHIVWERNTVWKDLLSLEKKSYNLDMDNDVVANSKMGDEASVHAKLMQLQMRTFNLPFSVGKYDTIQLPACIFTWQVVKLIVIIITFAILISVKTFNDPVQGRCLAVLVASAMLWASEALPLYITSMLVPLLCVTCKIIKTSDGQVMDSVSASQYILSQMWSSVIMILIGGFTLAAALSKYNVAKVVSSYILFAAGTKPRNVLLAIMGVSLFLSMWISNVASPVLCFSLIQPVLRTIPTESPFAKSLMLGIALASNIGGMASPIASPQNIIALESMDPNPGWGKWFAVALPVSFLSLIGIWLELILTFKINTVKLKRYTPIKDRLTAKQYFILMVTVATILLWCMLSQIESTFGESGQIAIIPVVLLFGTGLLKVDDLNNFPWSIVLLAMGGLALGKAVSSSGLLKTIAMALQRKIDHFDVFVILLIFGALVLVFATFVSHTVATLIIVPLVKQVGDALPTPHPQLLVMGTALVASAAMGLPTSGFPNVTAISMRDEVGKHYLTVNTFITRGVPASIIAYLIVITVGYGIMTAIQF